MAAGHDLANTDTGQRLADAGVTPVTANAYLGGLPIAEALGHGADVVVTGRVTDAALAVGPGMWRFGWSGDDLDALAGAVVAGHIIECGCQATGGNYAFFGEVPDLAQAGFPLAELAPDGSAVITKHPGTGGLVSVGTVTAQLLYEIGGPRYANPDVIARFDTIRLDPDGPDRVRVSGCRGEPPPADLKVALNYAGGYRNTMILVIEGLDVAAKAELALQTIWARVPGGRQGFAEVSTELVGSDPALLRITVLDADRAKVGRGFSAAVIETALASYPGLYALTPPGDASSYGVYWPTTVPASLVTARVIIDGEQAWAGPAQAQPPDRSAAAGGARKAPPPKAPAARPRHRPRRHRSRQARPASPGSSGPAGPAQPRRTRARNRAGAAGHDRGGALRRQGRQRQRRRVGAHPEAFAWLDGYLTAERLAELVPSTSGRQIERYRLPNLLALNFVVVGLLGRGVAASTRLDAQAKALGEELRAAAADIPRALVQGRQTGAAARG